MNIYNYDIYAIIEELRSTTSLNKKKEILKRYEDVEEFKKVLKFTYDSSYVFGIKKIPEPNYPEEYGKMSFEYLSLSRALNDLEEMLVKRKVRGHAATNFVASLLGNLRKKDQEVLKLVIQKDLKCGVNLKMIQEVFPDLIITVGYMGAVPYDPKKIQKIINQNYFIFSQEKMDGEYSNLIIEDDHITFLSRKNKEQKVPKKIIDKIKEEIEEFKKEFYFPDSIIFNGELLLEGYDRYTSNGLLTRIFKYEEYLEKEDEKKAKKALEIIEDTAEVSYEDLLEKFQYWIWDFQNQGMMYFQRFHLLFGETSPTGLASKIFKMVPTKIYFNNRSKSILERYDFDQDYINLIIDDLKFLIKCFCDPDTILSNISNHFSEILSQNGEGIIVKAGEEKWKDGKPVYQVKLKMEFECEMKIVGFKQGTPGTKFENALGAFITESEDGLVKADPSGITEDLRFEIWENKDKYLNKIITVKCNGLSKNKIDDSYSLLHPRFIKIRDDKVKADDLQTIIEIEESVKKLKEEE